MSGDREAVWHASIRVTASAEAVIAADFDWPADLEQPPTIACGETAADGLTTLDIYIAGRPSAALLAHITGRLAEISGADVVEPCFSPLPERDWVGESQKLHKPIEVGRFVIFGAHDADAIDPGKLPIRMEAGQAFGTGRHYSTYGVLKALDQLAGRIDPSTILDVGTGSGILAIAARRLWDARVLATDIDPVATETASENIRLNGVTDITCLTADGLEDPAIAANGPYDLILANILAEPLIGLAPAIARHAPAEGTVILSGLMNMQADTVMTAYRDVGFREQSRIREDDWTTLVLVQT